MKNIFKSITVTNILKLLKEIIVRFPLGITMMIVVFSLFSYLIIANDPYYSIENFLGKAITTSIIVFFLSIGMTLLTESGLTKKIGILLQCSAILFGLLFYGFFGGPLYFFFSEQFVYGGLILLGVISFLFFAPFIRKYLSKDYNRESYYSYFITMSFTFVVSCFLGGAIMLLGSIGIASVFTLFDLSFLDQGKFFGMWMNISFVLITPLFALSQLPKYIDISKNEKRVPGFLDTLISYVGVMAVSVYFVILYAYSVKVLLNFSEWPQGEVTWMVIGFSILGYIVYMLSYGMEEKNRFIVLFRKLLPYVVLPQLGMLFYAIYLRIAQYDLTINRYFVVAFGIWLTMISIYLIFSKKKHLIIIPTVLFDCILLISVGPWSVYNLPESRQVNILENSLIEANILQDGEISLPKNKDELNPELSGKIYDSIKYLIDNHGRESISELLPDLITEVLHERKEEKLKQLEEAIQHYLLEGDFDEVVKNLERRKEDLIEENYRMAGGPLIYRLQEKLKVKRYKIPNETLHYETLHLSLDYDTRNQGSFDISGYETLISMISHNNEWDIDNQDKTGAKYITVNLINNSLQLHESGQVLEQINIEAVSQKLLDLSGGTVLEEYGREELTFDIEGKIYDYRLLFEDVEIRNPDFNKKLMSSESQIGSYSNGKALLKKK